MPATWTLANGDGNITVAKAPRTFSISKSYAVTLTTSGNFLYLHYSFNVPNSGPRGKSTVSKRKLEIDYNIVASPTVSSAAELKTLVQSWLDSRDPFIVPVSSKTIVDNTVHQVEGSYEITGSLSLTIDGTGKLVIN